MASKPYAKISDEDLVAYLKKGDDKAFAELMKRYKTRIYGIAYRYLGNSEDAADVAQEVFVKVYRHIDKYVARARLKTWIYRIAANSAMDKIRAKRRRGEDVAESLDEMRESGIPEPTGAGANPGSNPRKELECKEMGELLQAKLLALPENYRMVFVLRECRQLSYHEIAEVTGLPLGTVRSRLNQARRKLRDMLAPYLAAT
ncbi:RNA polymerase sigma factor [Candidatus Hydrogenedentota bacterium]